MHRLPIGHNESVNYVHFPKLITSFGNHVIVKYRWSGIINKNLCIQQFEFPRHYSVKHRLGHSYVYVPCRKSTYIPTYPWHLKRVTLGRARKKNSTLSILYYHCGNEGSRSLHSFSCFGTYSGRAEWFLSI